MPLYPPSPNSGAGSAGAPGSAAPSSTTQVGGDNAGNLISLAVDASGNLFIDLLDGSGNPITSQVNGSKRALDVGIDVAGIQIDPRSIRALTSADVVTANAGSGTFTISGTVTANAGTNLNTSALALDTSVTGLQVSQGSTTSGQKGGLTLGAVTTAAPSYTTAQTSPLSLTTSGALRTDSSATTQPVSGTITANAGTGTFTENVSQFGGNNVVTGTGTSGSGIPRVTVSNDSNILATQSGSWTVTANAGTNLNTSALALDTSVNGILLSQGSTTSGEKGPLIQGAVTTSAPAYTTAQTSPLSLTTSGLLRVDGSGVTQPVSGTVTSNQGTANAIPWNENISQWGGSATTLGQKVMASSVPIVIASDQATALTPSTASVGNSSTATLGSNATFTGSYENVSNYAVISTSVFADQISAVNGLIFDWSSDGSNTDRSEPSSLTSTSNGRAFSLTVRAKFFRIRYTNGVSAQGAFRLGTTYHQTGYGHISKPLSQTLTDDNFAEPTASATFGRLTSGTWQSIGAVSFDGLGRLAVEQNNHAAYSTSQGTTFSVAPVATNAASSATINPIVLLSNPNGSGKTLYVHRISTGIDPTNRACTFGVYADPTVTANGSAATIVNNLIGNGTATVASAFTLPTVSANGSSMRNIVNGQNTAGVVIPVDGIIQVPPNHKLLITANPSANNTTVEITVVWYEE